MKLPFNLDIFRQKWYAAKPFCASFQVKFGSVGFQFNGDLNLRNFETVLFWRHIIQILQIHCVGTFADGWMRWCSFNWRKEDAPSELAWFGQDHVKGWWFPFAVIWRPGLHPAKEGDVKFGR